MEIRTIKTCEGWKQVQFLDGALLPEPLDLYVDSIINVAWIPLPSEYQRSRIDYLNLNHWVRFTLQPQTD